MKGKWEGGRARNIPVTETHGLVASRIGAWWEGGGCWEQTATQIHALDWELKRSNHGAHRPAYFCFFVF